MGFTPQKVIENATPDPNEVLVAGIGADGLPQNVLLRDTPELRAQLLATPATLPNPEHAAVSAELESASSDTEVLATQLAETPDDDPNRAALASTVHAAQATVASLIEQVAQTSPTLPNPDRTPIEAQAFTAAIAQAEAETAPAE